MMAGFPARQWKRQTLYDLVKRTDSTGSAERLRGRGRRRRSVRIDSNINLVSDLICSQDGKPGTSKSAVDRERDGNFAFFSCEDCQE